MEILKGIEMIDLALYIKDSKILILSDFHIGYEEELNKKGILIPRSQFKKTLERLKKLFLKLKENPNTIIINGDIKHEFGTISGQEWDDTLYLIDFLQTKSEKIILIKGNHDTIIGPIASKKNLELVDDFKIDDILITHGHKIPPDLKKTIIIAHEHPCIGLTDNIVLEKYKCFLKGKWNQHNLIVMPSFNLITEGTDILKDKLLSPFLKKNKIETFECFLVFDKIRYFGKIKDLLKSKIIKRDIY